MSQVDISQNARSVMVRPKVPPVRLVVFFLVVLVAAVVLVQTHPTQARPSSGNPTLKTIANIVVHAHHHSARSNQ